MVDSLLSPNKVPPDFRKTPPSAFDCTDFLPSSGALCRVEGYGALDECGPRDIGFRGLGLSVV